MPTVLVPVPSQDSDPTEVAISWRVLTDAGLTVRFATPNGARATCDELMVTGQGLDPWGAVPGLRRLVAVGRVLRADATARAAYADLQREHAWRHPLRWADVTLDDVDALVLPGGHRARGMRSYLESADLQALVVDAFARDLVVGAICHGVLLAARSVDPTTGRSVLHGRRTTALTWSLERTASRVARVTRFWDPFYYRTYRDGPGEPVGHMSVQAEVSRALASTDDFRDVDPASPDAKRQSGGRHRDTSDDPSPAFVVVDGRYVSARWPGDAHAFARQVAALVS